MVLSEPEIKKEEKLMPGLGSKKKQGNTNIDIGAMKSNAFMKKQDLKQTKELM